VLEQVFLHSTLAVVVAAVVMMVQQVPVEMVAAELEVILHPPAVDLG
tara:strand:+ start:456 stop:596 length:141 start_codon:yes stop_codon:yes gene_type:complete